MDYKIFLYIFFGVLPSLTWLSYYLTKDLHPEPKKTILKIFLWGALITLPVFFIQLGLTYLLSLTNWDPFLISVVYWFLVISLSEEIFKYVVVRLKILNSPDLDEPLDIMLYMVVTALGFAALENVLYLFSPTDMVSFNDLMNRTLTITLIRFIGATFLHTLCSAIIGYSMAVSLFDKKHRYIEFLSGMVIAVLLHGVYDFSIMQLEGYPKVVVPIITILTLAFLVFVGFEKLKKIKGVTILNDK